MRWIVDNQQGHPDRKAEGSRAESFVSLLAANYYRINAFILSLVPNEADADDIMQETTVLMWSKFEDFTLGTDFVAWAVTVAKYQVFNFRKTKRRSAVLLSEEALEIIATETKRVMDESDKRFQALKGCINKLSHHDRQFIKLRYTEGVTTKMLASRIGKPAYTVYRHGSHINGILLRCIKRTLRMEGIYDA